MTTLGAPLSLNEDNGEEELPEEAPEVDLSDEEVEQILDEISQDPLEELPEDG